MKATLLSLAIACALLLSSAASAQDHRNDSRDKDSNYGYDRNHQVTSEERARWEAQHKNDRHDDKNDRHDDKKDRHDDKNDRHDDKNDRHDDKNDHHDERRDKDSNYGYDKNHKVSPQERARWEAAHKNDHR